MNELEGFNDWSKVIVPKRAYVRKIQSLALSKPCFREVNARGCRGIFRINDFRRINNKTNASVLDGLKNALPSAIRLIAGFSRRSVRSAV